MIFVVFFQFKDVVMKRKRWLWIDNNLSASKTWLVVDGLTPGPYMLDCNHSRLSLLFRGRQAYCGRPTKKLAQCCGVATDCSSRFWRQGSIVCTFFFQEGGHCTKIADARLEIMKLESLNLGNRSESLWWLTVLCPAFNIDTLTLLFWHFCRLGWLFLALDLRHSVVRKTLKRRGNTVKEFSVLREFEIWYNVDVDEGWWRSASSPASNISSDYVFSSANTRWR